MAVTVTNASTGKVSLPFPFSTTLAAGASKSVADLKISDMSQRTKDRLTAMQNSGLVTVAETDDTLQRGSPQDASVADVRQIMSVGQSTPATGTVEHTALVERPSYLKEIVCYFDAVPTTDVITLTLERNGNSVLDAAFVVNSGSTLPSQAGVALANDLDNTDGAVLLADPNELSSAGATFTDAHIGNLVLINGGHTADGAYLIGARTDANNVDLTDLSGAAASFTDESSLSWDMYLNFEPGDMMVLKGVVSGTVSAVGLWVCQAVLTPR
jgi:hypothetical protein